MTLKEELEKALEYHLSCINSIYNRIENIKDDDGPQQDIYAVDDYILPEPNIVTKDMEHHQIKDEYKLRAIYKRKWPYNLIFEVLKKGQIQLHGEWEDYLEKVLDTLSEAQKEVILYLYKERKTRIWVCAALGISQIKFHQIFTNAISKLKHPSRRIYFLLCTDGEIILEEPSDRICFDIDERILNNVKKKFGENSPEYANILSKEAFPLCDLGLSVRAYRNLVASGYEYLDELIPFDENQLRTIRNIGANTADEIKNKMIERGIYIEEEQNE